MNYASVVRVLALLGLVMSTALGIGASVALVYREWLQLGAFAIALFLLLVLSVSLLLLTPKPTRRASPRDGLAVLTLWWGLAGLFGALPFIFDVPQGWVTAAVHESVSSLTTTGHVVIDPLSRPQGEWPVSLIVWRGLLHVLGAIASLVGAAAIFAALNLGGPGIHRTVLFSLPEGSFFAALPRVAVAAALTVTGIVTVVFVSLLGAGVPVGLALGDAVSVATTGLVVPGREAMAPSGAVHALVLGFGLVLSTLGLAVMIEARQGRWRNVVADREVLALAVLAALICGFAMIANLSPGDGLGVAISFLSTSGIPLSDPERAGDIPLILPLVAALIGGGALSAAGGLKLARLYLLTARAGEEFARLGFRDSVVVMRYRGRVLPDTAIVGIWVYLVAYIGALSGLLAVISLSGLDFDQAVSTAVGLLTNTGVLVDLAASNRPHLSDMVAIAAMLLGRLEVIAVIPLLSWGFWRG